MTLSYPTGIGGGLSDFVTFTPMEYRAQARGGSAPVGSGAQGVTLYMPNSTPMIGNQQVWNSMTGFRGPMGAATRDVVSGAADQIYDGTGIDGVKEKITAGLKSIDQQKAGSIAQQAGMNLLGDLSSTSPNQLLAFSRGKVYNPNVELLYDQPSFRNFNFQFDFVPTSASESLAMNNIIRNFKMNSAPEDLQNGMFKVPYVWQVQYHVGGAGENQFMNKFKPAACTAVSVQANQGTDMHVSHAQDGSPIQTSISLEFMEVEIITRKDHVNAGGQGY